MNAPVQLSASLRETESISFNTIPTHSYHSFCFSLSKDKFGISGKYAYLLSRRESDEKIDTTRMSVESI